jgi:signal transduction histidine kinase
LRTIVRVMLTSRYAMWVGWGPELAFLYNDAYAKMTLHGKHPWALDRPTREVWAEIWTELAPRIEQVLHTGEATWDEALLLFLQRHGFREESYHTFSYSPLPGDDGKVAGNLCVVTEVTDRVIGERRLAALRNLAAGLSQAGTESKVFDAIDRCLTADSRDLPFSLLFLFDEEGRATLAGNTGFGPEHDGVVNAFGRVAQGAFPEILEAAGPVVVRDLEARFGALPKGPWEKPPTELLVVPLAQQGQSRRLGVFVAGLNPYRLLDETFQSFVVLFAGQITSGIASARAYEAERRRAEALTNLDRAKTAFFSNISHEFRTPLTLMLGPTEDALRSDGLMKRPELETVHRNELRLLRLVNSLLDFSRIEAGRARATFEPTDLASLTSDFASTFRSAVERGGLAFDVHCPPLSEPVFVDRDMWEKVVLNLLSNAFKFTFDGTIRIALAESASEVTLRIEDSGVGIAAGELPRVFERFHRIEGTRSRTHEGSGIGLALVRDLVNLHGGSINVESELGRGTTFVVTVPKGRAHLPADAIAAVPRRPLQSTGVAEMFVAEMERWLPDDTGTAGTAADVAPEATSRAPRILVADDNADVRDYLKRLLGTRYRVELARDGAHALELVRQEPPDLVVTDVMMPLLDGFGLVASLREQAATRDLPVLMLSARAGEDPRIEGLRAGADDYLVKPFSARELLARIETLLLRADLRATEAMQRRQLWEIFRQAPAGIAVTSGPSHVFELANQRYLDFVSGRDVVGKTIREALPELAGQRIFELLDTVYRTGEPFVGAARLVKIQRTPDAEPEDHFFDFVYQPLRDGGAAPTGIVVVAFDVTELVTARREAETANRTKDEFLAMLGHELRNPLAPILTALELLRVKRVSGGDREHAVIERQVKHLVRLVDDLLDVSRITRGKVALKTERVELADAVTRAIEMTSPLFEQLRHELSVDVPVEGLAVDGDPGRLAQVIANLLMNAAKYTEPGGRVSVRAEARDGEAILVVSDGGMGIEPEMMPHIFDFFAQERQALDRAQGGLGLGLGIVKSLVSLHGGTVTATSAGRGHGAEFTVRLPLLTTGALAGARSAAVTGFQSKPAENFGKGARVLLVDDNVDAAEVLSEWLADAGFETVLAHDASSALHRAQSYEPHVAILDIGLPVMDGYELAKRLKEMPRFANTRLIALTGYGGDQDRRRSSEAGFFSHLVKPVDVSALARILERALIGIERPAPRS